MTSCIQFQLPLRGAVLESLACTVRCYDLDTSHYVSLPSRSASFTTFMAARVPIPAIAPCSPLLAMFVTIRGLDGVLKDIRSPVSPITGYRPRIASKLYWSCILPERGCDCFCAYACCLCFQLYPSEYILLSRLCSWAEPHVICDLGTGSCLSGADARLKE